MVPLNSANLSPLNFLDLLLLGIIIYFIVKMFKNKPNQQKPKRDSTLAQDEIEAMWNRLRSNKQPTPKQTQNFSEENFLKGAKLAYLKIKEALYEQDLNFLKDLVEPSFLEEIKQNSAYTPSTLPTFLKIEAYLQGLNQEKEHELATVLFESLVKNNNSTQNLREVWIFSRHLNSPQSTWKLRHIEKIQ